MQSGFSDISSTLLPAPRQSTVRARSVAASSGSSTVPLFVRKTAYPGIGGVMKAATELVAKYTGDERIRSLALTITRSVRRHSLTGQPDLRSADLIAEVIYKWMVRNINYVRDPWNIERIQSPAVTLAQKAGDCDDHAILGAALLQSLGIQTGFRIISRTGRTYDHIFAVYHSPDGWKSFDTTILKYPGFNFDEKQIAKSRLFVNKTAGGMGFEPVSTISAVTSAIGGGIGLKNTLSKLFSPGDKPQRQLRGNLREHLISQGVRSDVVSVSHKENHLLQRYAQLIDELGHAAVDQLNRYGSISQEFVSRQRKSIKNKNYALYGGLLAGGITLVSASVWAIKYFQS